MPSLSQRALGRSSPSGSSPHNTYQMTSQHPPVAPAAALPSTAGQQPLSPRSTMTGGGSATVHIPPTALPLDSSAITGSKLPFRERAKAFIRPYLKLWRNMHDIRLTAYSVLWFLFCTYVTCLSNSTVDRINPNSILPVDQRHALQDPLLQWSFKIFDKTGLPMDFADILVRIATALIFARCFTLKDKSFTVFRRTMYISGAVYLFRAPTVLLTVLPNPYLTCQSHPDPSLWMDAFNLMLQRRFSCGDVFFSGHSIFFTMVLRLYGMYSAWLPLKVAAGIFTFIGLFSLVFTTYHYTIDVMFAFTIVTTAFTIYHWIAKAKMGSRRWWGKIILSIDGERYMDIADGIPVNRRGSFLNESDDQVRHNGASSHGSMDDGSDDHDIFFGPVGPAAASPAGSQVPTSGTPATMVQLRRPSGASGRGMLVSEGSEVLLVDSEMAAAMLPIPSSPTKSFATKSMRGEGSSSMTGSEKPGKGSIAFDR